MPHDAPHAGHNGPGPLHSHLSDANREADLQDLCAGFIEGFRAAEDKTAFLRLAGVPFERADASGGAEMKLVDVRISSEYQVGTASPAFGTRDLSYQPFPGAMVRERTNLELVYVSIDRGVTVDLRTFLATRAVG